MNHPDARLLKSASFRRSMAGPDILSQIARGEVWMTITQGASAVWTTSEAIRNSYIHHDAA
jgi:hypothetical protein